MNNWSHGTNNQKRGKNNSENVNSFLSCSKTPVVTVSPTRRSLGELNLRHFQEFQVSSPRFGSYFEGRWLLAIVWHLVILDQMKPHMVLCYFTLHGYGNWLSTSFWRTWEISFPGTRDSCISRKQHELGQEIWKNDQKSKKVTKWHV